MQRLITPLTLLALGIPLAHADGTLTHMSGPVSVQKLDGKVQPGGAGTKVLPGETVITGAGGYVRMEMTDGGEIVLRPDSQLKVEGYKFVEAKPEEDSFIFSVIRGGMRTVTGLIGKRGNRDAYELKTQTATIGIRGTQFDLRVCQANCGALPDGTYLAVRFGAVQTANPQGTMNVAAGQVVHVPPAQPPVILPRDPGIGFTPPPVIPKLDEKKKIQAAPANSQSQGTPANKPGGSGSTSGATPSRGGATSSSSTTTSSSASSESNERSEARGGSNSQGSQSQSESRGGQGSSSSGGSSTSTSSVTSSGSGGTQSGATTNSPAVSSERASPPQAVMPIESVSMPAALNLQAPTQPATGLDCSVQ